MSKVTDEQTTADTPAEASRPSKRKWGLRRRILLMFTLGALMLSVLLAFITYGLARSSVLQQRDEAAKEAARLSGTIVIEALRSSPANAQPAMDRLEGFGVQRPLIWYANTWRSARPGYNENEVPQQLIDRVINEGIASRMIVEVDSEPNIVVGFLLDAETAYFEFFSLEEVSDTLQSVQLSLVLGTLITTALGVLAGSFAARRAVRPVGVAAQAAKSFASGRLDTRLEPTEDPDLSVLANSFNDMASALQERIERDGRFASDVSHELRSPLMTLSASVEVMDARRDEMPERAQAALDLLKSDVTRFQGLVGDLLEISRFDAGAVRLNLEELLAAEFVRQAVAVSSEPDTPVTVAPRAEAVLINGDRRRLARVVANLIDNARIHGGGEPEVSIEVVDPDSEPVSRIRIVVEDRGAGVPDHERDLVFERFARGGVAGRRAGSDGAGLGLSLVDEHVRMHGGRVWVEDRADGEPGARFVIELMAEEIDE
ncbi:MAG: ATP-binding protein [Ilumatobacter sp.]|uniref:HAMP domain-containing sensor histidine kinase n=1 Tax=Ilumatobacter sp. TaxID=1967498 RepID=UPI002615EF9D|nr:sensor histidine kinase [Ilumatobacter sp.]MDJ0768785.1 ATP-binding protein [Ilumatobacter sp.]